MAGSHLFLCTNCALPRGGGISDWSGKAAPWKPTARPDLVEAEATSGVNEAERTSKALCADITQASEQSCKDLSCWCPASGSLEGRGEEAPRESAARPEKAQGGRGGRPRLGSIPFRSQLGKQGSKKKWRQGGRQGRLPLHVLLRKPRERLKQSCV